MLDKLRDNSRSFGTYLIIGAISVVFVIFFGQGSLGFSDVMGGTPSYAAKVNGKTISLVDFQKQYGSLYAAYQQQAGGQFDEAMAEQLGLKETALDRLVDRQLLVDAARENGLAVSDAEVAEVVRGYTEFQKDGAFDFATYKAVLANAGLKPEAFEREIRNNLLAERMLQQVRQGAKATQAEIERAFERENDKANLVFVRLFPRHFATEAKPTPEEIAAWLATDEGKSAVATEYEAKKFRFEKPKRVRARHILVKVAEDAPAEEVEAAEKKLLDARKQLEEGADFAELAKQISDDEGTKEKGGDLGFFGPGAMAKPFEEAAMALAPGALSDVVRTRFGLHLIRVEEVQEAEKKSLEEVDDVLAAEILERRKAEELVKARAEEALAKVQAGASLTELFPAPEGEQAAAGAADGKPAAEETGLFSVRSEYVPKIGVSREVAVAARAAEAGQVLPRVFETSGAWVIATVKERVRPDPAQLEKEADTWRRRVVARKEAALLDSFTRGLRERATVEKNPVIFATAEQG